MIQFDGYCLRTMQEPDLPAVLSWRNSEHIRINMYNDRVITWEEHRAWFERTEHDENAVYKIFEHQGRPLGLVNYKLERVHSRATWGFYLGEQEAPPKSGLILGYLGISYAFEELGIRKLCGEVLAFNSRSIKFHEKLGFKAEGRFAEHISRNEKYEDIVFFALFKTDWEKIRTQLG